MMNTRAETPGVQGLAARASALQKAFGAAVFNTDIRPALDALVAKSNAVTIDGKTMCVFCADPRTVASDTAPMEGNLRAPLCTFHHSLITEGDYLLHGQAPPRFTCAVCKCSKPGTRKPQSWKKGFDKVCDECVIMLQTLKRW
jgi:hypothetical protein